MPSSLTTACKASLNAHVVLRLHIRSSLHMAATRTTPLQAQKQHSSGPALAARVSHLTHVIIIWAAVNAWERPLKGPHMRRGLHEPAARHRRERERGGARLQRRQVRRAEVRAAHVQHGGALPGLGAQRQERIVLVAPGRLGRKQACALAARAAGVSRHAREGMPCSYNSYVPVALRM